MTTFADRWEQALAANGLTNPKMAAALGHNGHQNINGWKKRGKVGSGSLAKVTRLLARTNMEWLQYGTGSPERFNAEQSLSQTNDLRQSYAARLDPATIRDVHTALSWRFQVATGKPYDLDRDSDLFSLAYAYAMSEEESDRIALQQAVDARITQLARGKLGHTDETAQRSGQTGAG